MSGQTPVERAAGPLVAAYGEALRDPRIPHVGQHAARAALTAALDVDELAAVLHDAVCTCDSTTHPQHWTKYGRAVVAHLTKGNENDE